jgi:phosphate uptake regulator
MEQRKLIKSGEGSFVVSLPIDWVRRNKLKKGNFVFVLDKGKDVLVFPEALEEKKSKQGVIDCHAKDFFEAKNKIISFYLNNFSEVSITNISVDNRQKIIEFVSYLPGYQISSEEINRIEISDVLSSEKIDFHNSMKRVDMMLRSSFQYILDSIEDKKKNFSLAKGRIQGNCFFLMRILKNILDNSSLAAKYKIDLSSILAYNKIVIEFENINDHLGSIGNLISSEKISNPKISAMLLKLRLLYEMAITAFYKKELKEAEKTLREKQKNKDLLASLISGNSSQKSSEIQIYNNFLEIEKSIRGIALITYDYATSVE